MKHLVCCSIECGLREVEETCETDDQTIYLAKSSKSKYFSGVITTISLATNHSVLEATYETAV